ncbi:DUF3618 domain-containing protein [Glaciihabitans sp. GrIS 2.15]|uniref:DUF3618 domain-containing protein n=1 Tax=Glaciihabitans sp. GrIS 2.15 TaxID=3071710 RepID=UPI002DFC38E4|nr:hypothetical protein [Glaciihabitans sp. GrIS 2.15]
MSDTPSSDSIETRISATRSELAQTLDEIEDRLNVPKQVGKLTAKVQSSYAENPVPWTIGATAAVVVIGGIVAWAIFGDD